jgi:hypothetical protein
MPRGDSLVDVHQAGGKRPIKAEIRSWVDADIGASHYYVTVKEKANCWWAPERNCWVTIYADSSDDGFSFEAAVFSQEAAEEVAEMFIEWIQAQPADYETYVVRDYSDECEHDEDWDDPEENEEEMRG